MQKRQDSPGFESRLVGKKQMKRSYRGLKERKAPRKRQNPKSEVQKRKKGEPAPMEDAHKKRGGGRLPANATGKEKAKKRRIAGSEISGGKTLN